MSFNIPVITMAYKKLVLHKEDPPSNEGYSFIGFFETFDKANDWYKNARRGGKKYPFWCNRKKSNHVGEYLLWWSKPKNSKMVGKGWG